MKKKKMHYAWWLVIGICILIIPTAVYLGFLIPAMKEDYIVLMSSGGVIGVGGMFGTSMIPDTTKFGTLYKTASKSFTMLVVITLVKDFVGQLLGLACVFAVCYIVFRIFKELWKNGKRKLENAELAKEVARSVNEASK